MTDIPDQDRRASGIAMFASQFGIPEAEVPDFMAHMLGQRMAEEAQFANSRTWTAEDLSLRDRSLIVIASLVAQGGVEARLRGHLRWALTNGATRAELDAEMVLLAGYVGYPKASIAMEILIDELGPLPEHSPQPAPDPATTSHSQPWSPMPANEQIAHTASIVLAVSPEEACAFMASGMNQTYWALGSWARVDEGDGLVSGTSLWDGSKLYIRIEARPELGLVDYFTGGAPGSLRHAVSARILDGEPLGHPKGTSVLTLTAWRTPEHTDEAWRRTFHAFHTEVHLIKGRLEHGVSAASPSG